MAKIAVPISKIATIGGLEKHSWQCAKLFAGRGHDVTVLTMGQYLRPSEKHLPVVEYILPEAFDRLREIALEKGFRHVASGPLVRSSYHAADFRPEVDEN